MRILVVGIGALGSVYSCLLKSQGHYVAGLDRAEIISDIKRDGVRVTGIWGDHKAHLDEQVFAIDQLQSRGFDLVILTVKSFDTERMTAQLKRVIGPHTYLLLAQNGYGNYDAAALSIPEENLILGRVIFGAETTDSGASKVTVIADDVIIGSPKKLIADEVMEGFAQFFRDAGIPTRASDQVMKYVWGKIIYNSALNSLGAILEVNYGKLAEIDESRLLMNSIVNEIFQVMTALYQETLWPNAEAYLEDFYSQMIPSTAAHHPSMLQDIQRGRRTEIDALNGAIVKLGKKMGVSTPVNEVITALVKAKEQLA
ncbi:MAG: ketopantoate reductase family protein [Methylocystaceae bacterium]